MKVRTLSYAALFVALYTLSYYVYHGLTHPVPLPGDSWDYHIPIAHTILSGVFLHPSGFRLPQWYYPGSSEAINALFILLRVPLTLSNVFAAVVFFFCLFKLGLVFRLRFFYSLLFALTGSTFNVIVRWLNAVSIDIWVGVFFILALILLENPRKSSRYFLALGFVLGMLIGSKYTGLLFIVSLFLFYGRSVWKVVSTKRFSLFMIPFSVFGLFWYLRNYLSTGNPVFPTPVLGLPSKDVFGGMNVFNVMWTHPSAMLDSAFAEYHMWVLAFVVGCAWLFYRFIIKQQREMDALIRLFLLGLLNLIFYLAFPTSEQSWIMVSSFRYSLPAFIPLVLGVFLLGQRYKKEEWIGYVTLGNMLITLTLAYHPKLVFFYVPLGPSIIYWLEKHQGEEMPARISSSTHKTAKSNS